MLNRRFIELLCVFIVLLTNISFQALAYSTAEGLLNQSEDVICNQNSFMQSKNNFWIKNIGQLPNYIKYYAINGNCRICISADFIIFQLITHLQCEHPIPNSAFNADILFHKGNKSAIYKGNISNIYVKFIGANLSNIIADKENITRINIFRGREARGWITDIPTYKKLRIKKIYLDIDLVFDFSEDDIIWYIESADYKNLSTISISIDTTNKAEYRDSSILVHNTFYSYEISYPCYAFKNLIASKPTENKKNVNDNSNKDSMQELLWGTYLGGTATQYPFSIKADQNDNVIVCGYTASNDIPVPNGYDQVLNGVVDFYIAKFNEQGDELLWATYIGGTDNDACESMILDSDDNIIVCGYTRSYDAPTPNGYFQDYNGGHNDAYLAKLNPDGNQLLWGTYFGGCDSDYGNSVSLDSNNNVILGVSSISNDIPSPGGYNQGLNGGYDIFIAKFSSAGDSLIWGTYIGGTYDDDDNLWYYRGDYCVAVAADFEDNVIVLGNTMSGDIPTPNGFDQDYNGNPYMHDYDIYAAKLNAGGNVLLWGTYIGGYLWDEAMDVSVDSKGNVIIVGDTESPNIPTPSGFDNENWGNDIYVCKLSGTGDKLIWGTYIGGFSSEYGNAVALDNNDNVIVGGVAFSDYIPTIYGYDQIHNGSSDFYVSKLSSEGNLILWGTFIGGMRADRLQGLSTDSQGNILVCGWTQSEDMPTPNGYDQSINSEDIYKRDMYLAKLTDVSLTGPDAALSEENISITPSCPLPGDIIYIHIKVENPGDVSIVSARIDVYFEQIGSENNRTLIDSITFGYIWPDESVTADVYWNTTDLSSNLYQVIATVADLVPYDVNAFNDSACKDVVLPLELESFGAIGSGNTVHIQWSTISEISNIEYNLYRLIGKKVSPFVSFVPVQLNNVSIQGQGGPGIPAAYFFTDYVKNGGEYIYILEAINPHGDPNKFRTRLIW